MRASSVDLISNGKNDSLVACTTSTYIRLKKIVDDLAWIVSHSARVPRAPIVLENGYILPEPYVFHPQITAAAANILINAAKDPEVAFADADFLRMTYTVTFGLGIGEQRIPFAARCAKFWDVAIQDCLNKEFAQVYDRPSIFGSDWQASFSTFCLSDIKIVRRN